MDTIESAKALLISHGYRIITPKMRKIGEYHEHVFRLVSQNQTQAMTVADLAANHDLIANSVGEAIHTLHKHGRVKPVGRGVSVRTGRVGQRWVAAEYYSSARSVN